MSAARPPPLGLFDTLFLRCVHHTHTQQVFRKSLKFVWKTARDETSNGGSTTRRAAAQRAREKGVGARERKTNGVGVKEKGVTKSENAAQRTYRLRRCLSGRAPIRSPSDTAAAMLRLPRELRI